MVAIVIVLYVFAGGLPILALWEVWERAGREREALRLSSGPSVQVGDFDKIIVAAKKAPFEMVVAAKRQLVMVGVGIGLGTIAGIWSLFITSSAS